MQITDSNQGPWDQKSNLLPWHYLGILQKVVPDSNQILCKDSWSPAMPMQNHVANSPCKIGLNGFFPVIDIKSYRFYCKIIFKARGNGILTSYELILAGFDEQNSCSVFETQLRLT